MHEIVDVQPCVPQNQLLSVLEDGHIDFCFSKQNMGLNFKAFFCKEFTIKYRISSREREKIGFAEIQSNP